MNKWDILEALLIVSLSIVISIILTYPVMLLWNLLMPTIFNLPELTFWQTFGLQILVSCFIPFRNNSGGRR